MPSQHAPDKVCVSTWVPRTLQRRLKHKAKLAQFPTLAEYIEHIFTTATEGIELTANDYREIANETEQARKKIDRRLRAARAAVKAAQGS